MAKSIPFQGLKITDNFCQVQILMESKGTGNLKGNNLHYRGQVIDLVTVKTVEVSWFRFALTY